MVKRVDAILNNISPKEIEEIAVTQQLTSQQQKLKILQQWINGGRDSLEKDLMKAIQDRSGNIKNLAELLKELKIEIHLKRG